MHVGFAWTIMHDREGRPQAMEGQVRWGPKGEEIQKAFGPTHNDQEEFFALIHVGKKWAPGVASIIKVPLTFWFFKQGPK